MIRLRLGAWTLSTGAACVAWLGSSLPGVALERVHCLAPKEPDGWKATTTTVALSYYNACTGWAYGWNMPVLSRLGVAFDCPPGTWTLTGMTLAFQGSTIPGYGYTGHLSVYSVDAQGCPVGMLLASVPLLPTDGFVSYPFNVSVPSSFLVLASVGAGRSWLPPPAGAFVSDHPGPGPTGPSACGTCYPSTRATHSYYYGAGNPLICPGTPFFDGVCNAELMWTASLRSTTTAAPETERRAWAAIKALYR